MKKILLATFVLVMTSLASFAQSGDVMATTHYVYSGITHTYQATGTDDFVWEVFSDVGCTAAVAEAADTYNFTTASNLNDVGMTWNKPAASPATYYLRLKQTDAKSCVNYKTLTVVVTSVDNMTFAFAGTATTEDCAVNISGVDIVFDVTLTGTHLVHEATKQARIEYAIGAGAKKWLDVDLVGAATGEGTYTITIPASDLVSADQEVDESFAINVYQLEDGNGALNDFTATPITHTWTATGLPTIVDITF